MPADDSQRLMVVSPLADDAEVSGGRYMQRLTKAGGKPPALAAQDVLNALLRAGFSIHHIKGSHHHLRHAEKPSLRVVVPIHRGDLPPRTVRSILHQAELSVDEFLKLL